MAKKKVKKVSKKEPIVTDILEEYFFNKKGGDEMVMRTYMNGDKKVKEEVVANK